MDSADERGLIRSLPPTIALGLALLVLAGCASRGAPASSTARTATPGGATPAFSGMRAALLRGTAPRERGDAEALRALGPSISRSGLALLQSRMPHDLRRADVERFLDQRAAFGSALKLWVQATEGGTPPQILGAYDQVVEAYWAWVDAYRGLSPERAV